MQELKCNDISCPIHNIQRTDEGIYTCSVSNTINGEEYSEKRSLILQVIGKLYTTFFALIICKLKLAQG